MTVAVTRPEPKPAPTQARARARRNAILEAANSFVMSGQIDTITTTTVARRAGIPVGSVYRYFDDRVDILDHLYRVAYGEIESGMADAQRAVPADMPMSDTIGYLLDVFVKTARSHPSFRILTKWANKHYAMWDVTPGQDSNLVSLIENILTDSGVSIPENRQAAATKIMVTTVSVLADLSIEEDDAEKAKALINELATMLEAYVETFGRNI